MTVLQSKLLTFGFMVLVSTPVVVSDERIGLCCLCQGCAQPLIPRGNIFVDSRGTTCNALALEMADPSNHIRQGNPACMQLKAWHYDRCCNPNHHPTPILQEPTTSPGNAYPQGPFQPCDLCRDGSFPRNPTTITAILGMPGNPSCRDLYWLALRGNIEDRICRPMQNYYEVPCGCIADSGGNNGGGAPDPSTPMPTSNKQLPWPPKKQIPPQASKDSTKISNSEGQRGNLHRRYLKGSQN